jgi:DNA-binding response OmpR family regulator
MRKTLLSVGTNHSLLGIRNTVLVSAGYSVIPAKSCVQAERLIASRQLDAVIVGHSLSRSLAERVAAAAKLRQLPVIVLHANPYEAPVVQADANLCGIDGAAQITQVLNGLLDGTPKHAVAIIAG